MNFNLHVYCRWEKVSDAPEMISADEALETGANAGAAVVLAELDGLVQPAIAIAQIGCLGSSEMDIKAFLRATTIHEWKISLESGA